MSMIAWLLLSQGQRFIKVAKSPISPTRAFPFNITSPGMSLLTDDDIELTGLDINKIHCEGLSWKDYIAGSISRIIFIGHMSSTFKSGALKESSHPSLTDFCY